MNRRAQLIGFWAGPAMLICFWLGFMELAGYLPPPGADLPAEQLVERLQANLNGFRAGMLITMFGFALMVPWAVAVAARLRRFEGDFPVLTYTQIGCVAIGSLIGQASTWIFEAVAYRLDSTSPEIIRTVHDIAWFTFLAPWPSFTIWCFAQALAILRDPREQPDFPRWTAFVCLWTGILFIPACLIFWFKTGPFSWNGLIAFYVPVGAFFVWVAALTIPGIKAVRSAAEHELTPALRQNPE